MVQTKQIQQIKFKTFRSSPVDNKGTVLILGKSKFCFIHHQVKLSLETFLTSSKLCQLDSFETG
jgi:hypothetical protein